MTDSVLEKLRLDSNTGMESEPIDDLGAFGYQRNPRDRCPMLELRKKDGCILAIGYAWLEQISFDPSTGITLSAGGKRIILRGRNLNAEIRPNVRLFQSLCRHRVIWVQEAGESLRMTALERDPLIEEIKW